MKTYRMKRGPNGLEATVDGRPLHHEVFHSPTGFEMGYGGSGPADLALSILADLLDDRRIMRRGDAQGRSLALHCYQEIKGRLIAGLRGDEAELTESDLWACIGQIDWLVDFALERLDDTDRTCLLLLTCPGLPFADLRRRFRRLGLIQSDSTISTLGARVAQRILADDPEAVS